MIPRWALPIAGLVVFAAACSPAQNGTQNNDDALYQSGTINDNGSRFISNRSGNVTNVPGDRSRLGIRQSRLDKGINNRNQGLNDSTTNRAQSINNIGFSRFNRAKMQTDGRAQAPNVHVNRDALANQIGYLVTAYPQISDATVLVTDDHVFIGVREANGRSLDRDTIEQVRKTALSVTPRYYKVRVTSDDFLQRRIAEIGHGLTNGGNLSDYRTDLSDLLRRMGDTAPTPR